MEQTISTGIHPRAQERISGEVLQCEPTIVVGTETVFRRPNSLADISNDIRDPRGNSKVDANGEPMGQTMGKYVLLRLLLVVLIVRSIV